MRSPAACEAGYCVLGLCIWRKDNVRAPGLPNRGLRFYFLRWVAASEEHQDNKLVGEIYGAYPDGTRTGME